MIVQRPGEGSEGALARRNTPERELSPAPARQAY